MRPIFLSFILVFAGLSSVAFAAERKVEIAVSKLTCPSCAFIVASSMRGVPSVQIDHFVEGPEYGEGVYSVIFDDAKTSVENILEAVTANGYPAQILPDTAS